VSALTDLSYNKIGDSTGEISPFSLWFLSFYGHFLCLHFSFDLSVSESSGYPERPSGSISQFEFYLLFQNFH
jgi:hypothetical protein